MLKESQMFRLNYFSILSMNKITNIGSFLVQKKNNYVLAYGVNGVFGR